MTNELHAVVMAGGSGTRFWPASRRRRPKQLLPLVGEKPLIAHTVARLQPLVREDRVWVVTNAEQHDGVRAALADHPAVRILIEPEARDTAPCVALAATAIEDRAPDATMVFVPADHLIEPEERFRALVERGAELAADDRSLVTFGIRPTFAATGYGYIEPSDRIDDEEPRAFRVRQFREKPDARTAEAFVSSGQMLWNSGIFVWRTKAIRAAMEHGAPELARCAAAMRDARARGDANGVDEAFRSAPRISIDFAVMERASHVVVVEADLRWHDLGSFLALGAVSPADADGNVHHLVHGATDLLLETRDCVVYADGPRTVALLGVSDLVVVELDDIVAICPRNRVGDLRQLRREFEQRGRDDLL
jgi:mannose-1-phosphate guanylyltransferase